MSKYFKGVDYNAIELNDSDYLLNKGAKLYVKGDYKHAVEYYRLSAALGNVHAISNLGYCYMYGRNVDQNMDLAILYFKLAANKGDVDALYKLGDVYRNGRRGVEQNIELGIYYLLKARDIVIDEGGRYYLQYYPSLSFALAKEYMSGEYVKQDLSDAFECLLRARTGYENEIKEGSSYYESCLYQVNQLIGSQEFDEIRKNYSFEEDTIEE